MFIRLPYNPVGGGVPVASTTFSDCAGTLKVFKYEDVNGDGKYYPGSRRGQSNKGLENLG